MRNRTIVMLLLAALLPSCVSSRLAETNQRAVESLATAAVQMDEGNVPLAEESVTTAAELTDATATFTQLANLGVPTDLTDRNFENVQQLSQAVTGTKEPRVAALANSAQATAGELAGKSRSQATFVTAAKQSPIGGWITDLAAILGGAGAAAYGATRGRKHLWRWWNTPSTDVPPEDAPKSDGPA